MIVRFKQSDKKTRPQTPSLDKRRGQNTGKGCLRFNSLGDGEWAIFFELMSDV